jgi:hypothetical protein
MRDVEYSRVLRAVGNGISSGWEKVRHMRILVFLHGTTIMHRAASGHTREEREFAGIDHLPEARVDLQCIRPQG